jgi:N-acetylmuramoyl-L-alanine amidase
VIVIDPGHNGRNYAHTAEINRLVDAGGFRKACNTTGTAGGSYSEAEFAWQVALQLRAALTAAGASVVLTRPSNDGWGPCIDERGLVAARRHAALLLSIHADGSGVGHRGFHVIHPTAIAGYTDGIVGPSSVLATAVRDSLMAHGLTPSNYIGSRGLIARGDLGTLNRAGVPAVMVESGNMRDPSDLALLRSPDAQRRMVAAYVDAIARFLSSR